MSNESSATQPSQPNKSKRYEQRRKTLIRQSLKEKTVVLVIGTINKMNNMAELMVKQHMDNNYYSYNTLFIYPQFESNVNTIAGDKFYQQKERIRVYLKSGIIDEVLVFGEIMNETIVEVAKFCKEEKIAITYDRRILSVRLNEYFNPPKK